MALRIFLFTIAALLSGAHFFRASNYTMVVLCLVTPLFDRFVALMKKA